jgi:tetratricopeptide (TPR) repeat protein
MALNARHRYIALNVGLWLLLALAGAAGIALLRQYGAAIAGHERARALIVRAEAHYEDGDFGACQVEISQALALSPSLLSELLERFGPRLLSLPNTLERLDASAEHPRGSTPSDSLALAQLAIIQGDVARASQLLERYVSDGGSDPRVSLWRGRIAANAARFTQARDEFARYWQVNASAKTTFTTAIRRASSGTDAEQRMQNGRSFFWAGLWDEAFAAFAEARQAGATEPELEFFQGVEADIAGKTEAARAHYTKTLDRLPNHLLSLRRLRAMTTASPS